VPVRQGRGSRLIVFVVDTSDSMSSAHQILLARQTALAVLEHAYITRSRVSILTFGNGNAEILLPPTSSVQRARRSSRRFPTEGGTPLALGLLTAVRLAKAEKSRGESDEQILAVISDGCATSPITPGGDLRRELHQIARDIRRSGISSVYLDTGNISQGTGTENFLPEIAELSGGVYYTLRTATV
jgi:magnesium chelatase subunit D